MTTPATPTPAPAPAGGRLPNGELRRQVAEYLDACAGAELTPRNVAAALGGKSSGAVGNALAALASGGYAEQTSTKPVRYRSTPTTTDAAAAPVAVPSATPRRRTPRPTPPVTPTTAPPPPAPTAAVPVTGPVTRPNGQLYHPRKLSGLPDVTALRKLRDAGVAALMYGPPGTGKTSVIEAAFGDLITIQGDGDTTVADIVGEYTQTPDGKFAFVHGPLVRAMREGRTLFVDDATLIPPTVLAVVYPAMDGRPRSSSRPTVARSSTPPPVSISWPGTTPACTARY
jgi:nitric oxide reductase NorQ protein